MADEFKITSQMTKKGLSYRRGNPAGLPEEKFEASPEMAALRK